MRFNEFSVSRQSAAGTPLRTPAYPFPGVFMLERVLAAVHLFTIDVLRMNAEADLDLRVDMTPLGERLEQCNMEQEKSQ